MKDNRKWVFLGVFLIVLTAIASFAIVRFSSRNADEEIQGITKNITAGTSESVKVEKLSDPTLLKIFEKTGFTLATTGKKHSRSLYYKFKTADGNQWVYCLELGNEFVSGSKTAGTGSYWNKTLTKEQRNLIERISVYGFPNVKRNDIVKNNVKDSTLTNEGIREYQFMVTQLLIWEVQQGWRDSNGILKDKTLFNMYIKDNAALQALYVDIATLVKNYDKIPSFATTTESKAKTETLAYDSSKKNYSKTFTDDSLEYFDKVVCPTGATCKKDGKTLTVTSTEQIKSGTIQLIKEIPQGVSQSLIVLDDNLSQRTMVGKAEIPGINAYLKITTEQLGKLIITKTVEVEGTPAEDYLKGFKFKVTGPNGYDQTFTTDNSGKITIENLKLGEYTITEVDVDEKYVQPKAQTAILENSKAVTKYFENELKDVSSIKIIKVDATTDLPIAGAELYVTTVSGDPSKKIDEWVSTDDGHYHKVDKNKIEIGKTYYVCESKAPDGYVVAKCESFKIESKLERIKIRFKDDKTETKIVKVDEKGNKLSGAELQVLDKNGKEIPGCDDCRWVSDGNDHTIRGLVIGTDYILRELSAPEGYVIAGDVKFKPEQKTITMTNTKQEVVIIKKSEDGKSLAGAVLKIIDKDKNVVVEPWTTKEGETHKVNLVPGEYYLVEEKAPDGYVKAANVKFTLLATDTRKEVTMIDDLTETLFSKTDAVTGEEIEGAYLEILDAEGNEVKNCSDCKWVSEKGKKHVVKGLIEGETYKLVETQAPDGYAISNEVIFVAGEKDVVPMENEITVVKIHKRDTETGKYVEGAILQLLDDEGNVIDEWTTTDGPREKKGLKTGVEYKLVEVKAPEDYLAAPEQTFSLGSTEVSRDINMYDTPFTPVENTAASSSVIAVVVGAILVIGGAGTVIWTRKKEA